jgi:hypothetical protein
MRIAPEDAGVMIDFFAALFQDATGMIELRALSPDSSPRQHFAPVGDYDSLIGWIARHASFNLYVAIATRRDASSGRLDNCATLGQVFTDVDYKTIPEATVRERLAQFPFRPSMAIATGGGLHLYWGLREPLDVRADDPLIRQLLAGLATYFGGDRNVAEPAHILRIPATLNYKYDPPRLVRVEYADPSRRYNPGELLEWLPAAPPDPGAANPQGFLAADEVATGSRHVYLYRVARSLKAKALSQTAVLAAVRAENQEKCRPSLDDDEAGNQVRKAFRQPDRPGFASPISLEPDAPTVPPAASATTSDYIEPIDAFLDEEDPPSIVVFPRLLPAGVLMLVHGDPRAKKSLVAFELALAAATGTAPFGLDRFRPAAALAVLYVQEEDPRALTRTRLRALVKARCGVARPTTLHIAARRGIDLDDPAWIDRLIGDLRRRDVKLLVLDAARRLLAKTDEGPQKVRELTAVLRRLMLETGVTIIIVHHDVKPSVNGPDQRRRGQRASGGDWFAASECPVHVERISKTESLVFPQDYKFTDDPAPFTIKTVVADDLVTQMLGTLLTTDDAERAGLRGTILDWLRANGPATRTDLKRAGLAQWPAIESTLEALIKEGKADSAPGRQRGSLRYFVPGQSSTPDLDDSRDGDDNER